MGTDQLIVLDFLAILLSLFATIYSGMQAEATSTCAELAALPVSIDTSSHNELKHARGFLERDLRPESLWTKSTSLTCIPSDIVGKAASSSSNDVAPDIDNLGNSSYDPIEVFRPSDMQHNVGFFLDHQVLCKHKCPLPGRSLRSGRWPTSRSMSLTGL